MASVTRKVRVGRDQRRSQTRLRLLGAVESLLEQGHTFTEISVEQVATTARVARSTFYAHFDDKGALLGALADHVTQVFEVAASQWYRLPRTATREDLKNALHVLVTSHIQHRSTMSAVVEAAAYDPRVRAAYEGVIDRRIAEMERSFLTQQSEGRLHRDVDVEQVTPWIAWMVERAPFQILRGGSAALEAHLDGMATVVWRTLYEGARE